MINKLPFEFEAPKGYSVKPVWTGEEFILGSSRVRVLEYSENFSGWSDDLTKLHEESIGSGHPIDVASRANAIRQIGKYITRSSMVIMEIGCSSGFLICEMQNKLKDVIIIGADVVKAPLYKLAQQVKNIPLVRFDLLQSPLPYSCVDVLVMLNVLEHIEDDIAALKNAYNILKPGGHLVVEVPAGSFLYDSYDRELQHFRRYSSLELQLKLKSVGFVIHKKSHLGFFLFPAFALVKLLNKMRGQSAISVVKNQAINTSNSKIVSALTRLESMLAHFITFPFGIRVLITAKKPL